MKDTRSVLLLLLSVGLVGTWIYHLYDKTQYSHRRTEVYIKDSTAIAEGVRDSLDKIYATAIKELDSRLASSENNTDSLKNTLGGKLAELTTLKNEVKDMLQNGIVTKDDLTIARKKIDELKQKVTTLEQENSLLKEETGNFRLILQKINLEIETLQQNVKQLIEENKALSEKVNRNSFFLASEISLNAIEVKKQKESETLQAKKTNKLVASFLVQNPVYDFNNTEVIAIVIQPDGQVLKNGEETAGNTTDKQDYTRKIHFDYIKGERRKIIFSLRPEKPQKGSYQLQIWHKGIMIGKTVKILS